jgi:hypothetical protein
MGTIHKSLPSVTLALVLTIDGRSEAIPVFQRDLLVDAAMIALRDMVWNTYQETNPAAAADRQEEAIIFSRVLRRLIPEVRELLGSIPMPEKEALIQ